MAKSKTVYEVKIDAEIGDLKRSLEQAKTALSSLGGSGFATGLDKKIANIVSTIDKLQKKAGQPIDSKATFSSLEKGFNSVIFDAKSLLSELNKISTLTTKEKISLLPEDEAKKLKEAISAVQAYDRALERLEKRRIKDLESAKVSKVETKEKLKTAKDDAKTAKGTYKAATEKGSKYGDATAIVAQAEAAKKAQKELVQLEKQLKDYRKELEELKKIENKTPEQESRMATVRGNISSVSGKIGAKTRAVNAGPDEKALIAAQKTIEEQGPEIDQLTKSVSTAEKEVARLEKALEGLKEKISENSEEIHSSQADYKVLYDQAKKLGVSLKGVTDKATPENVAILRDRLSELVEKGIEPVTTATRAMTPEMQKISEVAQDTADKVQAASHSYEALADDNARIDNLKSTIAQFVGWTGATKALSAALRNAFEDIKELDAVMTEIAVVTNFDIGDMWEQMPTYTARANDLGLAIKEVYQASALFYQQGLDTNEMIALSNETLKMAKIAGLNAAEATDRMTAALRGFNMELDEASAQKVADVYSELAAITASDVDEISSAMTKTASIASSAGMEFETTAAFLSQIIETTRESAETAGTAMKTVIARFQELKKSPDDIGEIDGEIVDANAIEGALRSVGVSLRDAGGQFRELDDVFLELSSKWDSLDKNTQRYIATIAAGSRQQSRFIAMMQDYSRTQELVAAANDSAGASSRQYEKTLDSIETKLNRLENAWTEFSTKLLNSDVVKLGVDFLTSVLHALNKVTEGFGGLTGSMAKIGTLIAVFQTAKVVVSKFWDQIVIKTINTARQAMSGINTEVVAGVQKTMQDVNNVASQANSSGQNQTQQQTNQQNTNAPAKMSATQKMAQGWQDLKKAQQPIQDAKDTQSFHTKNAAFEKEQIRILKEKRAIQKSIKSMDPTKDNEAIGKSQKALNELDKKYVATLKDKKKLIDEYSTKNIKSQKTVEEANREAVASSKKAIDTMANGAMQMSQNLTMVGVGIGAVGQLFSQLGMEEVGEAFSEVGNVITTLGSALMGVAAIIPMITSLFSGFVANLVAGGISVQAAWWWVVLIVAAIVALITLIAIAVKTAVENSPEGKLKKAQEAADAAGEAADRAAEAYDNLKESLDGLDDKYKNLEQLTKGTKEWNEAVQEINDSVLELIQQYPELASMVTQEGGMLKLDVDSAEVQQVLNAAKQNEITTRNAALKANMEVAKAEANVTKSNLNKQLGYISSNGKTVPIEAKFDTEQLAKALASGDIMDNGNKFVSSLSKQELQEKYDFDTSSLNNFYEILDDDINSLISFGQELAANEKQAEASFEAMATAAEQMANLSQYTADQQQQAKNLTDGATYSNIQSQVDSELSGLNMDRKDGEGADRDTGFYDNMTDEEMEAFNQALKNVYGADAKYDQKNGKVYYTDADGNYQKEELKKRSDQVKTQMSSIITANRHAAATEAAPIAIQALNRAVGSDAFSQLFQEQNGANLTEAAIEKIRGEDGTFDKSDAERYWSALGEEGQKAFTSFEEFTQKISSSLVASETEIDNAKIAASEMGFAIEGFMTADMAKGFTEKMREVFTISGEEGVRAIQGQYTNLLTGQTEETAAEITALLNGIDWTNQEDLLKFQTILYEKYGLSREKTEELITTMGDAAKATSSLTTVIETFGALYQSTQKIESATRKLSDLQWDYERLLKSGASAAELAANKEKQRQIALAKGEEALVAYEHARDNASKIYASGVNLSGVGEDLTKYVHFDPENGYYDVSELQKRINEGFFGSEGTDSRKAVEDYVAKLDEANNTAFEQLDIARESYEELEALNEESEKSYNNLIDVAKNSIVATMEKDISVQEDILNATEEVGEGIVSKIQEQIDTERQERENARAREDISDLQQQIAYLGMDTSGSADLERLQLNETLAEQEEDYLDSLIDQSLDSIQDANAKAAEQREQQIALQQAQLDLYKTSNKIEEDAKSIVKTFLDKVETEGLGVKEAGSQSGLISDALLNGMGLAEQNTLVQELEADASKVIAAQGQVTDSLFAGSDSAADLLSQINQKTTNDLLGQILYRDQFTAATEKEKQFKESTGFDIVGSSDINDYITDDGTFQTKNAQSYISSVDTITSTGAQDLLIESNTKGKGIYDNYSGKQSYKNAEGLISQDEFYRRINAGEDLTINGVHFNRDILNSALQRGSTTGSYEDYMTHWWYFNVDENSSRKQAISEATEFINNLQNYLSWDDLSSNAEFNGFKIKYMDNGGTNEGWLEALKPLYLDKFPYTPLENVSAHTVSQGAYLTYNGKNYPLTGESPALTMSAVTDEALLQKLPKQPKTEFIVYDNGIYGKPFGQWLQLGLARENISSRKKNPNYQSGVELLNTLRNIPYQYKTGGLADFTGPAWLDGTPSKPEYILNAEQTERFFSLIDVLEGFDTKGNTTSNSNDISVDVDINVESIGSDYDVEQLANKIRSMLRDDAMYRNVNNINQVR